MGTHASGGNHKCSYFQVVIKTMWRHVACTIGGMKLTQLILTTISRELSNGNPWWALVVANEYLEPTSQLHKVLVKLFKGRVDEDSDLTRRIHSGARYADLSAAERDRVGSRATFHRPSILALPCNRTERRHACGRRSPVRRPLCPNPEAGASLQLKPTHRVSRSLTSMPSLAAPSLRIVQEVARRSS